MEFIKNKRSILCFVVLLFCCFFIFSANICLAQNTSQIILPGAGSEKCDCSVKIKSEACKQHCGDYELNDFVRVGINASQWILGIVGSLALLMFIYGGVMMITAGVSTRAEGGKDKRVNIGKDAIENAVVGLVIVFTAYIIIGFVFKATGVDLSETAWSKTSWFSEKIKTGETK